MMFSNTMKQENPNDMFGHKAGLTEQLHQPQNPLFTTKPMAPKPPPSMPMNQPPPIPPTNSMAPTAPVGTYHPMSPVGEPPMQPNVNPDEMNPDVQRRQRVTNYVNKLRR